MHPHHGAFCSAGFAAAGTGGFPPISAGRGFAAGTAAGATAAAPGTGAAATSSAESAVDLRRGALQLEMRCVDADTAAAVAEPAVRAPAATAVVRFDTRSTALAAVAEAACVIWDVTVTVRLSSPRRMSDMLRVEPLSCRGIFTQPGSMIVRWESRQLHLTQGHSSSQSVPHVR